MTSEEAVLLALGNREELFDSLYEMVSSDNYVKVLMAVETGETQGDIADKIGVGQTTVSRAISELIEFELVVETDDGYERTLQALGHPLIQYYFHNEVIGDD